MATKKMTYQRFMALPDSEKKAFVAPFEKGAHESQFRPMTPAERKRWKKSVRETKKLRGRPTVGAGSKHIAVTIEQTLLSRADKFAKAHGLKRSQMIAQSLVTFMSRAG